ncbi:MAG: hypothetical protein JW927_06410 [Deltaproteobacteria bacterium]|nr:hypothetical protein [Deltaproteobacteria bacterium]
MVKRIVCILFICIAALSLSFNSFAQIKVTPSTSPNIKNKLNPVVKIPAIEKIQQIKPDLIVQSIRINPANPKNGGQASSTDFGPGFLVYATIKNQGSDQAFLPKGWRLAASKNMGFRDDYNSFNYHETNNITLPPGVSQEVLAGNFRSAELSPAGTWAVWVKANPDNQISESNYANNEKSIQVTVANVPTAPQAAPGDLVISSLRIEPAYATIAGNFKLIAIVKNIGGTAISLPSYWKAINFSNAETNCGMQYNSMNLAAGQSIEYQCSPMRLQTGTFTWTVTTDPQQKVNEQSETNNTKSIQVTINPQ